MTVKKLHTPVPIPGEWDKLYRYSGKLSSAQLQAINPDVIVCQMSALGGTWRGKDGWENRVGYDPIDNMPSGLLAHYGSLEYPQYFGGISADLMGGFSAAFGALLGVYQRQETGVAGEGRSSLARATTFNQLVWMIYKNGSSNWGEPHGQFAVGPNGYQRLYACGDKRWIYVHAEEGRASRFAEVVTGIAEADERALEAAFAGKSSEHWLKKLDDADIACHAVLCAEDICVESRIRPVCNEAADETAGATLEIFRWDDHPSGRPLMMPSMSWVRVGEDHSYLRLTPTPKVGAHTKEILTELGYGDEAVAELIRLKIAHEYLPAIGSRDEYFFQDYTPEVRGW